MNDDDAGDDDAVNDAVLPDAGNPPGDEVGAPRVTVVVAEDDAIIRMDLVDILGEEGYEVLASSGRGDEALGQIRDLRPDVAVLDVKMPGLDGIEVARQVTEEAICGVVLVTAFSQRKLIDAARDAGVMSYIVKPFQRADIVPAIEMAVGRFADLAAVGAERDDLVERLAVRKLLDRAKAALMADHSLTEQAAFTFLQRRAMNQRVSLRVVAEAVLAGELAP